MPKCIWVTSRMRDMHETDNAKYQWGGNKHINNQAHVLFSQVARWQGN